MGGGGVVCGGGPPVFRDLVLFLMLLAIFKAELPGCDNRNLSFPVDMIGLYCEFKLAPVALVAMTVVLVKPKPRSFSPTDNEFTTAVLSDL